jgi:hypothetical protein
MIHNAPSSCCLCLQVVPPIKTSDFKLTVSTNREAVQVMDLFSDMVAQVGHRGGTAVRHCILQ